MVQSEGKQSRRENIVILASTGCLIAEAIYTIHQITADEHNQLSGNKSDT
jgi:hypothetical protein